MAEENNGDNNNNGDNGGNWFDAFPDDVKGWDEVTNSQTPDQFWQRITNHRQHIGQSIRIPTEDASAEDMQAFYDKLSNRAPNLMPTPEADNESAVGEIMKRLGLPEDVKGYGDIEGEGVAFNEGQLDQLKQLSHEAGLTKSQFAKLAQKIGENTLNETNALEDARNAATEELKNDWGMAAQDRLNETNTFLKQSGAPESIGEALANSSLDAATTKWLYELSKNVHETSEGSNQNNGNFNSGALDPYEAEQRIGEILGNSQHPYHRGDKRAQAKMHELMKAAGSM